MTTYGANVDWPSEDDLCFEYEEEKHSDNDFSTVLMLAIRKQDLPMVRLLLDHGADANKATPKFAGGEDESGDENDDEKPGELPLSVAFKTGNEAIIELLKSKGEHE